MQVGARPECGCKTSDAVSVMRSEIARIPFAEVGLHLVPPLKWVQTPLRVTVPSGDAKVAVKYFLREN